MEDVNGRKCEVKVRFLLPAQHYFCYFFTAFRLFYVALSLWVIYSEAAWHSLESDNH